MATLMEGREYGLASNALSEENKTVVHFKLTDTALKTLEHYSRNKNGRATIKFNGGTGIIKIPSFGNQPERIFQLSLSAISGDPNGSFDCINQNSKSLTSLGTMQHRVSVNATDDVFDRTRAKMTMAEEESKKVCTKEIKPSGRHIGKKVKKVLPPGSLKIPPPLSKSSSNTKSSTTSSGASRQSFGGSSSLSSLSTSSPMSSSMVSPSSSAVGQSRHSPTPNSILSVSKAPSVNSTNQSRVLTSTTTKQSSGAINMPYRDRIIHLLALKPYKKPELILRLQKDGIREKDKNSLGTVLQQVATLSRDNSYILSRGAWADVRLDWPFYTEQDRVLLKKNLQLESRAAPTSPAVSPASNPESPGNTQKRPVEEAEDSAANPNKKKRIAHTDRRQVEERPVSVVKPTLNQQSSPTANRENLDGANEDNNTENPDYISKFIKIEDSDQRQQYKQEFNREYVEYRELHKEVDEVARKFQKLRSQINETEEGTRDFEMLKKQVLEEYEAQKSDPKFMEKKQRMDYLHQKLGHIKRLIHEYDQRIDAITNSYRFA
ncbi:RNA polymerase II elongation factor ELL2 [Biomphalaria glabrata]|uniref:RNA polymerase II elongation factor ELL2-like n=1 Tax=Biomphalaria glabrata TaxID=6526 RepID=A0A2C9K4N5_BIOGL|nr:RNA polymerase II elongation factor ELL2-like [Biomphalaria glabrata]XP_055892524.1 RNA polymerase II elongation factor ELL2-like [Biomphalaria glabrata]XP_055892528.1 RNA polymerase II elongation factor ELL2-like [Biomphalaria glabrata]KAI8769987.1 RNA polymerase II elongation factor ELL2-like [Biomphalaria glabrata]